jgi:hypothetical protein
MEKDKHFKEIVQVVKEKASLKQRIYRNTVDMFSRFEKQAEAIIEELKKETENFDKGVRLEFNPKGEFEFEIVIGGDVLVLTMHTNVFGFDVDHPLWKTGYVKEDISRNYCGMIQIFNFLADSFKYNRVNDVGHLIGRIFINKENHYFMEGKRQLNFLFNDFVHQKIEENTIQVILEQAVLYSMGFDLTVPDYRRVQKVSVGQMIEDSASMRISTSKKMGYRFSFDEE